jgi:hypothetical protein
MPLLVCPEDTSSVCPLLTVTIIWTMKTIPLRRFREMAALSLPARQYVAATALWQRHPGPAQSKVRGAKVVATVRL